MNGCIIVDTLNLDVKRPYEEQICAVTSDPTTGNNLIIWEKTPAVNTEYFNIYRESNFVGMYDVIGSVPFANESVFLDHDSNPLTQSYNYRITAVDDCGNESEQSKVHRTIHLTSNLGVNGEVNLIWSNYDGIPLTTLNILRGTSLNQLTLLTQRPANTFTFTDANPPLGGPVYYRIEAQLPSPCTPTNRSAEFLSIFSNISQNNLVSVGEPEIAREVSLSSNPASDEVVIKNQSARGLGMRLLDLSGRLLKEDFIESNSALRIAVTSYPAGVLLVNFITEEGTWTRRITIQK